MNASDGFGADETESVDVVVLPVVVLPVVDPLAAVLPVEGLLERDPVVVAEEPLPAEPLALDPVLELLAPLAP